ncbi:MAG: polysaccharide biosynthesis protein [Pseudomonadota bacterium]
MSSHASDQIRQGGPVTVRGRGTNRYFMAVSEACELIIQAAGLAEGGETFMLKMGEPVSIHALARSMIELSGLSVKDELNPDGDIEISITEMEPGEKTTEELLYDPTASEPTKHSKIVRVKKMTRAHLTVGDAIKAVQEGVATQSNNQIRTAIFDALTRCQQDVIASAEANVVPFALKHPRK